MKNILLVEDEESLINIVASVLEDEGFLVKKSLSAEEALLACRDSYPDLIISDVKMENADGFAFIEKIKNENSVQEIPFIFVTGLDDTSSKQRAETLGASAYMTKPFDIDELVELVKSILIPASFPLQD